MQLLLGRPPLTAPSPLDHLLLELVDTRRGKAALGHADNHTGCSPGGLPGQAPHPLPLAKRRRELGIPSRTGRNTALIGNAASLPAKVLSDLLELSIIGAARWTALVGTSGNACAAEVSRRSDPGSRT